MDQRTRDLRNVCEPIGANVYFAPEAHQRYTALGLQGYGSGYFCSRSASMGTLSGLAVVSAFGVFSPAVVVPAVDAGWAVTTREPVLQARYDGAVASLRRLLGEPDAKSLARAVELLQRGLAVAEGAGHAIYSGLRSLPWPDDPVGQLWRCCDLVREHRGDSHISVWTKALVRPVEIQLMSELTMNIPLKTYSATRGWTVAEMDAALDGMRAKGWMTGDEFSPEGRAFRERIESDTDAMETPIVDAIGPDLDELLDILRPWASAIVRVGIEGGGYPGGAAAVAQMSRQAR
jgi:helix-turn-helix protein